MSNHEADISNRNRGTNGTNVANGKNNGNRSNQIQTNRNSGGKKK